MRYGEIRPGNKFVDEESSIFKVIEVRALEGGRVQIGIEPTWKNHNGPRYFSRDANEIVGRYIDVYDHDLLPCGAVKREQHQVDPTLS